jgi:hypothetical protein
MRFFSINLTIFPFRIFRGPFWKNPSKKCKMSKLSEWAAVRRISRTCPAAGARDPQEVQNKLVSAPDEGASSDQRLKDEIFTTE